MRLLVAGSRAVTDAAAVAAAIEAALVEWCEWPDAVLVIAAKRDRVAQAAERWGLANGCTVDVSSEAAQAQAATHAVVLYGSDMEPLLRLLDRSGAVPRIVVGSPEDDIPF